jgi:hypothetical protein
MHSFFSEYFLFSIAYNVPAIYDVFAVAIKKKHTKAVGRMGFFGGQGAKATKRIDVCYALKKRATKHRARTHGVLHFSPHGIINISTIKIKNGALLSNRTKLFQDIDSCNLVK